MTTHMRPTTSEPAAPPGGGSRLAPPRDAARPARTWRAVLVDLACGAIAATGQAPLNLWPLTILALAVLTARIAATPTPRAAFARAMAAGTGYFAVAMVWIVEPFLVEPEIYGWMAPFALILMALGGGLFWALPGWLAAKWGTAPTARAASFALAMVLSDWVRGWLFTGLPWALTGHVWIATPAGQIAAWLGSIGLSALTMAAAALPVLEYRRGGRGGGFARGATLAVALIGAAWLAGLARLAQPEPPAPGPVLRLVQPNADEGRKWHPDWIWVFYQRLLDLSAQPPAPGHARPDAVIWPETAVPFLLDQGGEALPEMARSAQGAPLIFGVQRRDGSKFFNSLVELDAAGQVTTVYDKFHLVPFGEYIPYGDVAARFGIGAFAAQQGFGYTPGAGARTLNLAGLPPVQPLICYEAVFSRHLREVGTRPDWLVQITNDSWFGTFSGPYQHLAQARLRAIESGLPLMRAANTGITASIDARGHVRDSLPLGVEGAIDAPLPGALPPTLWWRFGDWPIIALCVILLIFVKMPRNLRLTGKRR